MDTLVMSGAPAIFADGAEGQVRLNRRGELGVMDYRQLMKQAGQMFQVSNAAKQTALAAGGTSYSDTAPAFNFDVPAGITMFPELIRLRQCGTVAGGVITYLVTWDNAVRLTSGTQLTIRNVRSDAPYASGCTAYANPTIAALSQHNEVCGGIMAMDVATSPSLAGNMLELTSEFLPILVGPASFQIYTFAGTTQPSWFYRIVWGEMASIYVK